MCNRSSRFALFLAVTLLSPGLAPPRKMDKGTDKKWLDEVRPILLPDEDKTYKGLKEKGDRLEFQKIFWARRDPDLATRRTSSRRGTWPRGRRPTRRTACRRRPARPPTAAGPSSFSGSRTR